MPIGRRLTFRHFIISSAFPPSTNNTTRYEGARHSRVGSNLLVGQHTWTCVESSRHRRIEGVARGEDQVWMSAAQRERGVRGRAAREHRGWTTRTGHNRSRGRRNAGGVGVGRPSRPTFPPQPPPPAHARAMEDQQNPTGSKPGPDRVKHRPGGPPLRGAGGVECSSIAAPTSTHSGLIPLSEI